jgi:glycosyltransferase involved in cell wall biosynthesis
MIVLFFTQKIDQDDPVLGFTCHWIDALARRIEQVHCLALATGRLPHFPPNVAVQSLSKEKGCGRIRMVWESQRALHSIFSRASVDAVFVHMAPEFAILSYPQAALRRIPIYMWYTHRQVTFALRVATALSHTILTASPESFRLKTSKVLSMGHGIPTRWLNETKGEDEKASDVLAVGRLSPIKGLETFIDAASLLKDTDLRFRIIGDVATSSDRRYREKLERLAREKELSSVLTFEGGVPHQSIPLYYHRALCTFNAAARGLFDKVVLESMACGKPAVTSNLSFAPLFGEDGRYLLFPDGDAPALAQRIEAIRTMPNEERIALGLRLQGIVEEKHGLERLMDNIVELFSST